ncbi:MAG: hypothetical protein DI536_17080 [Archangium gephyra]|uniref:Uncharacterized protein n=1 Tax=Archangium gephyra TaxID=48 RepID=A0A2W5TFK7_9BACT|nr:MAG: hypothetical protein DI536_17080 [Archangium gephyra]
MKTTKKNESAVRFVVHTGMPELQREAKTRGWLDKGWKTLSVRWQEVRWTNDGWKTSHAVDGREGTFPVAAPAGTEVEFAVRLGLACHADHDQKQVQNLSEVWLNNDGRNYRQVTA